MHANFGGRSTRPLLSYAFPQCQKCQKCQKCHSISAKVPKLAMALLALLAVAPTLLVSNQLNAIVRNRILWFRIRKPILFWVDKVGDNYGNNNGKINEKEIAKQSLSSPKMLQVSLNFLSICMIYLLIRTCQKILITFIARGRILRNTNISYVLLLLQFPLLQGLEWR